PLAEHGLFSDSVSPALPSSSGLGEERDSDSNFSEMIEIMRN
ncbi:unnamed protein product, partial [marine sediment metagenome]